jgi:hypothetical protein
MTLRQDLEAELLSRLQVASNSTLYPASRITSLIQNAYMWATQFVIWHDLVRAVCSHTVENQEYYDYPANFRSESVIRMEVDNLEYRRKNYEDYLAFKRENPNSTKRMFASFGRQFFISPIPTVTGSENLTVWGAIQADPLTSNTSVPIFSYNKEEANEAVIKKAFSVAVLRSDAGLSQSEEASSIIILSKLSSDENKNTQRNQRLEHPMFDIPDYYGNNGVSPIGRFNYSPDGGEE